MNQYYTEWRAFGYEGLRHVQMIHHPSKKEIAGFIAKPGTTRYDKGTALYTLLTHMFEATDMNVSAATEIMNHFSF